MAEYQVTLVDRQRIARETMAFWFETNGTGFDFRAGQHADFVFKHPSVEGESDNSRTFSLASSPHDKRPVMIAMRMRKTAFKNALNAAALGTKFAVSRPRGSFILQDVDSKENMRVSKSTRPSAGESRLSNPLDPVSMLKFGLHSYASLQR
jgi:ferredoxin-NADP reductase